MTAAEPADRPEGPFGDLSPTTLRREGHLKWSAPDARLLGADAAEMDFGTAPVVREALSSAVQRDLLGYLPPTLECHLGEACAQWQAQSYGWAVSGEDVHVIPDVIRALHLAIEYFSRPGSPVIVPVPAYMPFLIVPQLLGRRIIEIDMVVVEGRCSYDLAQLDHAYRDGGDLLLLCNPHNPLGRVMDADELIALSAVVDRHGGRVFSDEIHSPLVYPGRRHTPYASLSEVTAGHCVTAVSASKAWNVAGLKCAQMILSNDADRHRWSGLGRLATDGTSILGVIAATAAFSHGRPWLDDVLDYLDRNRTLLAELLADQLPDVVYTPPEGTYLGWLDCRSLKLPAGKLDDFFRVEAGVSVVDGASCGASSSGFVRLNFATSQKILTQIVGQLSEAVLRTPHHGWRR